jgi:hypothetical protein
MDRPGQGQHHRLMAQTRKNPPSATNAERAKDISAGGVKSGPIVPQPTDSTQQVRRLGGVR